jgi:hypothetical protein
MFLILSSIVFRSPLAFRRVERFCRSSLPAAGSWLDDARWLPDDMGKETQIYNTPDSTVKR